MRTLFILLALLVSITIFGQNTKVLFIGNSITYFNNMPQTFADIAKSHGDTVDITVYAPGGTGFANHLVDPTVYNHFMAGDWDYVILQPGSNESPGFSYPISTTMQRARILKDSIKKYSPCAKVLFYEISYGVWGTTPANVYTYDTTMFRIRRNIQLLADSTKSFLAPAGECIKTIWDRNPSDLLWGSAGNIHPNNKGSYIIACSFYASIFQKPSFGTTENGTLSPQTAIRYQQLVDSLVLDSLAEWRINTYSQKTDFNFTINATTVNFNSLSANVDSINWDFGNGNSSNLTNPTHTYSQAGDYEVILTSYNYGCTQTVKKHINIIISSLNSNNIESDIINYPNPFNEYIIVENISSNINNIEVYNVIGQNISDDISFKVQGNKILINTTNLDRGMYFIKIGNVVKKVIKNTY